MFQENIRVILISADPGGTLRAVSEKGITVHNVTVEEDGMTCRFVIPASAYQTLEAVATRRGDSLQVLERKGAVRILYGLRRRPVLLFGLLFVFALTMYLPTRILFFQVSGNENLSDREILSAAESCGVYFGISRRELRSEKMKNAILEAMPQLQWAGINTSGCVATISVRERSTSQEKKQDSGVSSIVAVRDGVISEITVERGDGMCQVGQAVKEGQVLISGYTDCGLTIRATRAQGEIYASTQRALTVISPAVQSQRGEKTETTKNFTLILGKKRINFYKGSGISYSSCVKMYSESYLTLPGGFQLPIGIATEVIEEYDCAECAVSSDQSPGLEDFARNYLVQQMVAGQILSARLEPGTTEDLIFLQGEYACREMIGKVRSEEIIDNYGN